MCLDIMLTNNDVMFFGRTFYFLILVFLSRLFCCRLVIGYNIKLIKVMIDKCFEGNTNAFFKTLIAKLFSIPKEGEFLGEQNQAIIVAFLY